MFIKLNSFSHFAPKRLLWSPDFTAIQMKCLRFLCVADPTTLPDARVLFLPSLCSACHWKQMKRFPKRRNALPNFTQLCVKLSPSIEIRPLSHLLVLFALHRHLFRYHRKWFLFLLSGNKLNILWVLVNKRHLRTSSDTLGSTFLRGFLIFIDQKSN